MFWLLGEKHGRIMSSSVFWIFCFYCLVVTETTFINQFAVHIKGGQNGLNRVLQSTGLINKGQIGSLADHYFLEIPNQVRKSLEHSKEHHSLLSSHSDKIERINSYVIFEKVTKHTSKAEWTLFGQYCPGYLKNAVGPRKWLKNLKKLQCIVIVIMPTALKRRPQTTYSLYKDIEWANKQIDGPSEAKKAKINNGADHEEYKDDEDHGDDNDEYEEGSQHVNQKEITKLKKKDKIINHRKLRGRLGVKSSTFDQNVDDYDDDDHVNDEEDDLDENYNHGDDKKDDSDEEERDHDEDEKDKSCVDHEEDENHGDDEDHADDDEEEAVQKKDGVEEKRDENGADHKEDKDDEDHGEDNDEYEEGSQHVNQKEITKLKKKDKIINYRKLRGRLGVKSSTFDQNVDDYDDDDHVNDEEDDLDENYNHGDDKKDDDSDEEERDHDEDEKDKSCVDHEEDKNHGDDEDHADDDEEEAVQKKDGVEEKRDENGADHKEDKDDEDHGEDNDEYEEGSQHVNQKEITKLKKKDKIINHRKLRGRLGVKSSTFDQNVDDYDDDDHVNDEEDDLDENYNHGDDKKDDDSDEEERDHDEDEKDKSCVDHEEDEDHGDDKDHDEDNDEYEEGSQQVNQKEITKLKKKDKIINHRKLRERLEVKSSKFDQNLDDEDDDDHGDDEEDDDDDLDEDYNHGDDEKDDDSDEEEEDDDEEENDEEDDDNHSDIEKDKDNDQVDDEDRDKYGEGNQENSDENQEKKMKMKKEVRIKNKDAKRDINNNKIYYRKLLTCKFDKNGQKKKRETVWNQAHACKFCGLIKTNISKHLRKHKIQREIKDLNSMIKSLGNKHKHVKAKWDLLRCEGDHKHNLKVLQDGEGEIILARRSHEKLDISEYGPCPGCFAWLKMGKTLVTHQIKCPSNVLCGNPSDFIKLTKKELHVRSLEAANKLSSVASRALKQEVFTIMTNDKISKIAKSDSLIICLGNLWLLKNVGNRLKRKYYASARMRDAARYLIHLRKETGYSKHSMEEFLSPEYFNFLVRCALLTASPTFDDEEDLKSPSTALKIGYDLKRMIAAKWAEAIKSKTSEKVAQCKDLFKLIKFEWSLKVSKLATTTLSYRNFNKEHSLPEADDLCKLQQHIKEEIKELDLKDSSYSNYRRVGVLAETRILLFNKRRSGEVEAMRVSEYLRRKDVSNIEKSMREGLTALENHLLTSQDLIEVRGKNGRGVPVIIPSDTKTLLKYLANAENRSNALIYDSNRYLFPNARHGVLRAYDSLKSLCKEIELSKPHKITSVNMRKYTATIAQIFDLNTNQQQWLLNHLGHSMDVHKVHYRQTSGLIERIDMAKLMLMQEFNLTSKYAGKRLEDIQLNELVFNHTVDDCDVSTQELTEALDLDNDNVDDDFQPAMNDAGKDEFSFTDDEDDDYNHTTKKKRSTKVSTRVKWNNEEETEIKIFFKEYFLTKATPGREVHWYEQQVHKARYKRDIVANPQADNLNDKLYVDQWYLHGGGKRGFDMNVIPAWKKGYSGRNVVISILDDGIERTHPDLLQNYDPFASYDVNEHDHDPMPRYDSTDENRHGTRCAGEVSAVANNTFCGVGIAFNSKIGGVRMLDGEVYDAVEAASLSFNTSHIDIYSASWGPDDDGRVVDGPGPLAKKAFQDGISKGRQGKGSIYVWASGNGGNAQDSCNCDGYTNSVHTLSISSTSEHGLKPWYLEECSSTLATTYSSGAYSEKQIVTVDLHGRCTETHTGTSASAPLAAGVVALVLEANPSLTWRDVQYITLMAANPSPMSDGNWVVNGLGRQVSLRYGYGLMDASAMVDLAEVWTNVPEQHICEISSNVHNQQLDGSTYVGYIETQACQGTGKEVKFLEHVQVKIALEHKRRGDVIIRVKSPQGTKSTLLPRRPNDRQAGEFKNWPFLSVHFWGENPTGIWTLEIEDAKTYNPHGSTGGLLKSWSIVYHGTATQPVNLRNETRVPTSTTAPITTKKPTTSQPFTGPSTTPTPFTCHEECKENCTGPDANNCIECKHVSLAGQCTDVCPESFYNNRGVCQGCHSTCKTCSGPTLSECLSCRSNSYYTEKHHVCVEKCLPGYYKVNADCLRCHRKCKECIEVSDHCTACVHGMELFGTTCIKAGSKPHIKIPQSMQGVVLALVVLCVFLLSFILLIIAFLYAKNRNLFCWSYKYDKLPCSDDMTISVNQKDFYDEDDISA